jgi:hypothetical protein
MLPAEFETANAGVARLCCATERALGFAMYMDLTLKGHWDSLCRGIFCYYVGTETISYQFLSKLK